MVSKTVTTVEDHRYHESVVLTVINCGDCGGTYSINEKFRATCYHKGTGWTCPYCKSGWGYYKNNKDAEIARLKRAKERADMAAREAHQQTVDANNRARAQKAAKTRLKNRIAAGVCPCCNRTFQNLARHIAGQHPDYSSSQTRHAESQ